MVNRQDFRLISLKILNDTFSSKRWVKESIEENMSDINEEKRDIGKIYELVYGILRNKTLIDYNLSKYIKKPVTDKVLINILRIGYYQLRRMDSIPDYAAINTCVELAKEYVHPKTSGFINAVLRNILRNDKKDAVIPEKNQREYMSIKYSYEKWMVKLFQINYPEQAEQIMKESNRKAPMYIRTNTIKVTSKELQDNLEEAGVILEKVKAVKDAFVVMEGNAITTESFANGEFYVQDLASQILGTIISPTNKDAVIDVGSAPGGKAMYMAQMMGNKGSIVAMDPDKMRSRMIDNNIARLGVENVQVINHDATESLPSFNDAADIVLVDAPCSALGIIRRHPEKKWCMEQDELKEFPKLQLKILSTVKDWVKKGGYLYYSTCTINPNENEKVIEKFLENNSDFKAEDVVEKDGKFKDFKHGKQFLSLPGNEMNTDGFFIAKLARKR